MHMDSLKSKNLERQTKEQNSMTYYELTIFIKSKKRALCTAIFENKQSLENFVLSLSSDSMLIRLGDVIFRRDDFNYAEIKEKVIKK